MDAKVFATFGVSGRSNRSMFATVAICLALARPVIGQAPPAGPPTSLLLRTNKEAPFCFRPGGTRKWPIASRPFDKGVEVSLAIQQQNREIARGPKLDVLGLNTTVTPDGWLRVTATPDATSESLTLEVRLSRGIDIVETQAIELRPAPPPRPISYYADFCDEIIRIFWDPSENRFRPIEKSGFDQYFRRLQTHGVTRLIVWQSPFPFMADPQNYRQEEWNRYATQTKAIIESDLLSAAIDGRKGMATWSWIRQLMQLRLSRDFGDMLTRSAAEHGVALTASYRPFEAALTKYYSVPSFDEDGKFLWNFLPFASPTHNYHPEAVAQTHYRQILATSLQADKGQLSSIRINGCQNAGQATERWKAQHDNLRIRASAIPPLQLDSFVLQRSINGQFRLRHFGSIRPTVEAKLVELRGYELDLESPNVVRISNLQIPNGMPYLWLDNPAAIAGTAQLGFDFASDSPVELFATAGNRLGRENCYWVAPDGDEQANLTRIAGISANGEFHSEFQVTEASIVRFANPPRRMLERETLVVNLGELFSSELLDCDLPATRYQIVAELRSILARPPFDEILINTRSHTQLAGYMADGELGLAPSAAYRAKNKPFTPLGLEMAYAPRSVARPLGWVGSGVAPVQVEEVSTWQNGEWLAACQTPRGPYTWRMARNQEIASGIRVLLVDLERTFSDRRIRVVIPEREVVRSNTRGALDRMLKPDGTTFGADYLRHIIGSLNYIPAVAEGMTLLDLSGLRTEPVMLGVRHLPGREPFKFFVAECLRDMRDNHGSSFHGPRSFFYEAQESLRASTPAQANTFRQEREHHICHLLSQRGDINEVILYEAADWLYYLPISDRDLCAHGYLDRCETITTVDPPPNLPR